ncbi:response regulator transcription factor [Algivirga pacifica]|uniref:Response regulator transcription factor n=1 Tax=Algivirga pacifica TaxID=1162670 RepID=A0ABP9DLE8_9BACT
MKKKLLIVEDDPYLGFLVKELFESKGYEVVLKENGVDGTQAFFIAQPDLCILDVMLPDKDGFTLAKEIRAVNQQIPIIFLTAKTMTEDVVKGFKIGGNDYVKKPFSMEELLVRVDALLARNKGQSLPLGGQDKSYTLGNVLFNYHFQELQMGTETISLTPREAELLKMLSDNLQEVVSRKLILMQLWGDDSFFNGRSLDVFMAKLRKRLKKTDVIVQTIRGEGYRLLVKE